MDPWLTQAQGHSRNTGTFVKSLTTRSSRWQPRNTFTIHIGFQITHTHTHTQTDTSIEGNDLYTVLLLFSVGWWKWQRPSRLTAFKAVVKSLLGNRSLQTVHLHCIRRTSSAGSSRWVCLDRFPSRICCLTRGALCPGKHLAPKPTGGQ